MHTIAGTSSLWIHILPSLVFVYSSAKHTQRYAIPSRSCNSVAVREVDSALIVNYQPKGKDGEKLRDHDCYLKIKAFTGWAPREDRKLLVQINEVQIDNCDTTLRIFFADQASGKEPDVKLSCHEAKFQPRYVTNGPYVTFRLHSETLEGYKFEILVTSFFQITEGCSELNCHDDYKCIHSDLRCDSQTNCPSGSDEQGCYGDFNVETYQSFKWGVKAFVGIAFAIILIVILVAVLVVFCCKRNTSHRRPPRGYTQTPTSTTQLPVSEVALHGRKVSFPLTRANCANPTYNTNQKAPYYNGMNKSQASAGHNGSKNLLPQDGIYPTTSKGTYGGQPPPTNVSYNPSLEEIKMVDT